GDERPPGVLRVARVAIVGRGGRAVVGTGERLAVARLVVGVHLQGLADLAQVAGTLDAVGLFTGPVQGRQQDRDQQRDDADHDQQLYEGKAPRGSDGTQLHKEAPFRKRLGDGRLWAGRSEG